MYFIQKKRSVKQIPESGIIIQNLSIFLFSQGIVSSIFVICFQVLDVIVNKDQRGRKAVEYLIHFQVRPDVMDICNC